MPSTLNKKTSMHCGPIFFTLPHLILFLSADRSTVSNQSAQKHRSKVRKDTTSFRMHKQSKLLIKIHNRTQNVPIFHGIPLKQCCICDITIRHLYSYSRYSVSSFCTVLFKYKLLIFGHFSFLRNVKTKYIFMIDVDFVPSPELEIMARFVVRPCNVTYV